LCVAQVAENPLLTIQQGDRLVFQHGFRRFVLSLSYTLPAGFLNRLDPAGGPPILNLAR
jgi:hypothetical protein